VQGNSPAGLRREGGWARGKRVTLRSGQGGDKGGILVDVGAQTEKEIPEKTKKREHTG